MALQIQIADTVVPIVFLRVRTLKYTNIFVLVFFNILILFLFYFISVHDIYLHEKAHVAIAYNFGCNESETHIDYLTGQGYFVCSSYLPETTPEMLIQEEYLHSINEIVSYNTQKFSYLLFVIIFLLLNIFLLLL